MGNEYNIFSSEGKVAFASMKLKGYDYMPIKVFKDLPTDPLSSIHQFLQNGAWRRSYDSNHGKSG